MPQRLMCLSLINLPRGATRDFKARTYQKFFGPDYTVLGKYFLLSDLRLPSLHTTPPPKIKEILRETEKANGSYYQGLFGLKKLPALCCLHRHRDKIVCCSLGMLIMCGSVVYVCKSLKKTALVMASMLLSITRVIHVIIKLPLFLIKL